MTKKLLTEILKKVSRLKTVHQVETQEKMRNPTRTGVKRIALLAAFILAKNLGEITKKNFIEIFTNELEAIGQNMASPVRPWKEN